MHKGGLTIRDLPSQWMDLMDIALEKEKERKILKGLDYGAAVTDARRAQKLFSAVKEATHVVLHIREGNEEQNPHLEVSRRMERLPRETLRLYGVFLPLTIILLSMTFLLPAGGIEVWGMRACILFFLVFPIIYRQRLRLNIAHDCSYRRETDGMSVIEIDQLPEKQFISYVAHEYAHHVFYSKYGDLNDSWVKKGWCRLVQWAVVNYFYGREGNPAYLGHVLEQIAGELKCACEMVAMSLRMGLPGPLRRIRTPYSTNSLAAFLTGKPLFDVRRHAVHSVGTARFFLAAKKWGIDEALKNPRRVVEEALHAS